VVERGNITVEYSMPEIKRIEREQKDDSEHFELSIPWLIKISSKRVSAKVIIVIVVVLLCLLAMAKL